MADHEEIKYNGIGFLIHKTYGRSIERFQGTSHRIAIIIIKLNYKCTNK